MTEVKTVSLEVNGRWFQAEEGATILEVAKREGIHIPTICHHEALEPVGACRLCLVEITHPDWKGWKGLVTACLYPVEEGLQVTTEPPTSRSWRPSRGSRQRRSRRTRRIRCVSCAACACVSVRPRDATPLAPAVAGSNETSCSRSTSPRRIALAAPVAPISARRVRSPMKIRAKSARFGAIRLRCPSVRLVAGPSCRNGNWNTRQRRRISIRIIFRLVQPVRSRAP